MKRRKFLIYSFLVGFGMMLVPTSGLANDKIVIPLPEAEEHSRHGNFNLTESSNIQLPNGVSNLRFQRFYKNGFADSPDDLCLVTFEFNEETVIIQFKFSELCEKGYLDCETAPKKLNNNIFTLI
jgi:hypothetical protein